MSEHMDRKALKGLSQRGCHDCAPKAWREVPVIAGDYDLDATIAHRKNADLPHRLAMYTGQVAGTTDRYTPRGYHGYSNHGDD